MKVKENNKTKFKNTGSVNVKTVKPKNLLKSSNGTNDTSELSISGALVLLFRVSQIVGIAPVTLKRRFDGYRVSVSRFLTIWNYFVETGWVVSACIALHIDLHEPPARSVRAFSSTRRFVWLFDFTVVMLISCLAVFRAPKRTKALLQCLAKVQRINLNLNVRPKKFEELKKCVIVLLIVVFYATVIVLDFCFILKIARLFDKTGVQVKLTQNYLGYYYSYIALFTLELQFVYCALEIHRAMKSLNDLLEELLQAAAAVSLQKTQGLHTSTRINILSPKTYNHTIDNLFNSNTYSGVPKNFKMIDETIRHLALTHSIACDAVRQLNECFTPEILVYLLSFLMHLVVTPYNLIANISGDRINMELLMTQVMWCITHFVCTVALVEPCHITQDEGLRTNQLISKLMLESTDELVKRELNVFASYLQFNNVVYSPMGVCVLARSLVASIMGSVTTYLVVIIQFQATEEKYK